MHCVEQGGVGHTILERSTDLRPEVPSPRQLQLRDIVLDLQLFTERLERLPYTFAHVTMLREVFRAVQQVVAQPFVLSRRYSTGPGPCHSLALHRAPFTAEETFGRSPEKRRPTLRLGVAMEAARRSRLQALQELRGIQVPTETELNPAGQHDLPQTALRKRRKSTLDVLSPTLKVGAVLTEHRCRQQSSARTLRQGEVFDLLHYLRGLIRIPGEHQVADQHRLRLPRVHLEARQDEPVSAERSPFLIGLAKGIEARPAVIARP